MKSPALATAAVVFAAALAAVHGFLHGFHVSRTHGLSRFVGTHRAPTCVGPSSTIRRSQSEASRDDGDRSSNCRSGPPQRQKSGDTADRYGIVYDIDMPRNGRELAKSLRESVDAIGSGTPSPVAIFPLVPVEANLEKQLGRKRGRGDSRNQQPATQPAAYSQLLSCYLYDMEPSVVADCVWLLGILHMNSNQLPGGGRGGTLGTDTDQHSDIDVLARKSNEDPAYLHELLVDVITKLHANTELLTEIDVSKSFIGIAKLQGSSSQSSWRYLPTNKLLEMVYGHLSVLRSQAMCNVIWSLGQIGARYDDLPMAVQSDLHSRLAVLLRSMNGQGLSSTLVGLQKLQYRWEMLPYYLRNSFYSSICRLCTQMSPQSVSNTLFALGELGARAGSAATVASSQSASDTSAKAANHSYAAKKADVALPDRVLIALEVALQSSAEKMRGRDVMQALQGMSSLGMRWERETAPSGSQWRPGAGAGAGRGRRSDRDLRGQGQAGSGGGTGLTNRTKELLGEALYGRSKVWAKVGPSQASEIGSVVYHLGLMGARWESLHAPLKAALLVGVTVLADFDMDDALMLDKDLYIAREKLKYAKIRDASMRDASTKADKVPSEKRDMHAVDSLDALDSLVSVVFDEDEAQAAGAEENLQSTDELDSEPEKRYRSDAGRGISGGDLRASSDTTPRLIRESARSKQSTTTHFTQEQRERFAQEQYKLYVRRQRLKQSKIVSQARHLEHAISQLQRDGDGGAGMGAGAASGTMSAIHEASTFETESTQQLRKLLGLADFDQFTGKGPAGSREKASPKLPQSESQFASMNEKKIKSVDDRDDTEGLSEVVASPTAGQQDSNRRHGSRSSSSPSVLQPRHQETERTFLRRRLDEHAMAVANVFYGLRHLGVPIDRLPPRARESLWASAGMFCKELSEQGYLMTVRSLCYMHAEWDCAPAQVKQNLLNSLCARMQKHMDHDDVRYLGALKVQAEHTDASEGQGSSRHDGAYEEKKLQQLTTVAMAAEHLTMEMEVPVSVGTGAGDVHMRMVPVSASGSSGSSGSRGKGARPPSASSSFGSGGEDASRSGEGTASGKRRLVNDERPQEEGGSQGSPPSRKQEQGGSTGAGSADNSGSRTWSSGRFLRIPSQPHSATSSRTSETSESPGGAKTSQPSSSHRNEGSPTSWTSPTDQCTNDTGIWQRRNSLTDNSEGLAVAPTAPAADVSSGAFLDRAGSDYPDWSLNATINSLLSLAGMGMRASDLSPEHTRTLHAYLARALDVPTGGPMQHEAARKPLPLHDYAMLWHALGQVQCDYGALPAALRCLMRDHFVAYANAVTVETASYVQEDFVTIFRGLTALRCGRLAFNALDSGTPDHAASASTSASVGGSETRPRPALTRLLQLIVPYMKSHNRAATATALGSASIYVEIAGLRSARDSKINSKTSSKSNSDIKTGASAAVTAPLSWPKVSVGAGSRKKEQLAPRTAQAGVAASEKRGAARDNRRAEQTDTGKDRDVDAYTVDDLIAPEVEWDPVMATRQGDKSFEKIFALMDELIGEFGTWERVSATKRDHLNARLQNVLRKEKRRLLQYQKSQGRSARPRQGLAAEGATDGATMKRKFEQSVHANMLTLLGMLGRLGAAAHCFSPGTQMHVVGYVTQIASSMRAGAGAALPGGLPLGGDGGDANAAWEADEEADEDAGLLAVMQGMQDLGFAGDDEAAPHLEGLQ